MIAMSRGIGPLGLPVMPAGTPAAAPAPGGAAPGAFDAAFADLAAALLATAAGAGQPATGKGAVAAAAGETPAVGDDAPDDSSASAVPVVVPMPVTTPVAFVPSLPAVGGSGDTVIDAATADDITSGDGVASSVPFGPGVASGGAAISSEILGGDDIRDGWVDETLGHETRDADGGDAGPVHTPIDPILPAGVRRQPAPAPVQPVAANGDARPGLPMAGVTDAARGQAPVPAHAQAAPTTAPGAVVGEHVPATVEASDVSAAAPPAEIGPESTPQTPPAAIEAPVVPSVPGLARRAEALQRALGRRADAEHGDSAPAGLAVQAARVGATVVADTPADGQNTNDGGESAAHQRHALRMATAGAAIAASSAAPAPTARAATAPSGHADQTTAGTTNWRAAAMAARFAEPTAPSTESARPASTPAAAATFAAAVVAAEMPPLRDARPATIEAPMRLPQEAVTAEHVQMQIVKSMRLQWTGATQEARVQLRPEYLGEVVANIKVEQGVVTATLHADTPEVRRLLETQTASLREALVEHGLKLDKVVIAEPETPSGQPGDRRSRGRQPQPESSRPKPRRARGDGDAATFELSTE